MSHIKRSEARAIENSIFLRSMLAIIPVGIVIYNHPIVLAYMVGLSIILGLIGFMLCRAMEAVPDECVERFVFAWFALPAPIYVIGSLTVPAWPMALIAWVVVTVVGLMSAMFFMQVEESFEIYTDAWRGL